jgi:hypothetical protein
MKNHIKLYATAGIVLLVVIIFWAVKQSSYTAELDISIAPAGSNLKINGHGSDGRVVKLKPGKYTLTVSHTGFADGKSVVTINKGDKRFTGFVLEPNTAASSDWYQTHPDDQKLAEKISSQTFDQIGAQQLEKLPILKSLPFIDQLFRVDYGQSVARANDPTAVAIYITYYSPEGKLEIIYKTPTP